MPATTTRPDLTTLVKGSRIRARWFQAELVSLAGAQMKLGAQGMEVVGIIKHFRGDHPTDPKEVRIYIDPEGDYKGEKVDVYGCTCGRQHVMLKPEWVSEIL